MQTFPLVPQRTKAEFCKTAWNLSKKAARSYPGRLVSFFPTLALTRSGYVGIFSDSDLETPQKREHK
jgi:hypothetical protein